MNIRVISLIALGLFNLSPSVLAVGGPLDPSHLTFRYMECRVVGSAFPNYPMGARVNFDALHEAIVSTGFISNIIIRNPRLVGGMLGSVAVTGQSFAQGPMGPFPFQVALGLKLGNGELTLTPMRGVGVNLFTPASVSRVGAPDAELRCDLQLTES